MDYYKLLNLSCEPFSTSPDPKFLYLSRAHKNALFRIRIAVELRRGLSILAGDIGTGKSTLARKLSQIFYEDPKMDFHAVLNPVHHDNDQFLRTLLTTFHISTQVAQQGPMNCLHAIEKYLFQKGLKEKKTVVLLIDEAQLLSHPSLEVLRALLNYETNEYKLLQLILVGQLELVSKLEQVPNFWDRISLKLLIPPLDGQETFEMIAYRLRQAVHQSGSGPALDRPGPGPLFTPGAIHKIYQYAQGYPRRINMLCHDALSYLVMMDLKQADEQVIERIRMTEEHFLNLAYLRDPSRAGGSFEQTADYLIENGFIIDHKQ